MTDIDFGTIVHGTLRIEDLLEAFASELERLDSADDYSSLIEDSKNWRARGYEFANDTLERLFGALNEYAPPYCYFGSHPGDGSDYGFWPDIEALEEAARDGEILKVSDASEIPSDYVGGVIIVNDHGNVTFGSTHTQFTPIWDCV